MRWLYRLIVGCAHADTFRERRNVDGIDVMHLVCRDCSHATPAISRTVAQLKDYRHARPAHEQLKAQKADPATVVRGKFQNRGPR